MKTKFRKLLKNKKLITLVAVPTLILVLIGGYFLKGFLDEQYRQNNYRQNATVLVETDISYDFKILKETITKLEAAPLVKTTQLDKSKILFDGTLVSNLRKRFEDMNKQVSVYPNWTNDYKKIAANAKELNKEINELPTPELVETEITNLKSKVAELDSSLAESLPYITFYNEISVFTADYWATNPNHLISKISRDQATAKLDKLVAPSDEFKPLIADLRALNTYGRSLIEIQEKYNKNAPFKFSDLVKHGQAEEAEMHALTVPDLQMLDNSLIKSSFEKFTKIKTNLNEIETEIAQIRFKLGTKTKNSDDGLHRYQNDALGIRIKYDPKKYAFEQEEDSSLPWVIAYDASSGEYKTNTRLEYFQRNPKVLINFSSNDGRSYEERPGKMNTVDKKALADIGIDKQYEGVYGETSNVSSRFRGPCEEKYEQLTYDLKLSANVYAEIGLRVKPDCSKPLPEDMDTLGDPEVQKTLVKIREVLANIEFRD